MGAVDAPGIGDLGGVQRDPTGSDEPNHAWSTPDG